jgi:hypothetical protein
MRRKIAECQRKFIRVKEYGMAPTQYWNISIAVSARSSFPTLVINSAGRNNRTHIFEISREEDLRILDLEAITP